IWETDSKVYGATYSASTGDWTETASPLSAVGNNGGPLRIASNGVDKAVATWPGSDSNLYAVRYVSGSWQTAEDFGSIQPGNVATVAMNEDGDAVVAWAHNDPGEADAWKKPKIAARLLIDD